MSIEELLSKVKIIGDKNGAILLGKYIACDGSTVERPISVITHAHGDHTKQFESALSYCESVLVTPQTRDLLIAEKGNWLRRRTNLIGLPYNKTFHYKDERVTLYPVTHMLGACQVLFENGDGTRIVYTGDFNYPNTQVLKADVVVMEATYGQPEDVRTRSNDVLIGKLISLAKEELQRNKPVYVFAHRGKIQCLTGKLSDSGICVPFLLLKQDLEWALVYSKHGVNIGNVCQQRTKDAYEIMKRNEPYVSFHRIGSNVPEAENHFTVRASGWMAKQDFYQPRKDYCVVALSDHADFNGLVEYAKKSEAKLIITDGSRSGKAQTLAKDIEKRLGVKARSLPY